jgi:hypothetical protein
MRLPADERQRNFTVHHRTVFVTAQPTKYLPTLPYRTLPYRTLYSTVVPRAYSRAKTDGAERHRALRSPLGQLSVSLPTVFCPLNEAIPIVILPFKLLRVTLRSSTVLPLTTHSNLEELPKLPYLTLPYFTLLYLTRESQGLDQLCS